MGILRKFNFYGLKPCRILPLFLFFSDIFTLSLNGVVMTR